MTYGDETMQKHFFISDTDGSLHDCRDQDWAKNPLRKNYRGKRGAIGSLADIKAALRDGPYIWPGGYPCYFITQDGGVLSFEAVKEEFHQVCWDWLNNASTGWRVVACNANYEDTDLICDHTGEQIESAYGE